jgi:hypothetical protein
MPAAAIAAAGVILRRENVARRPAHLGAERCQRFDEHRRLHRHVDAADDASAFQRLLRLVLPAQRHQSRHFGFGQTNLLAAEFGELDVRHFVVLLGHCVAPF